MQELISCNGPKKLLIPIGFFEDQQFYEVGDQTCSVSSLHITGKNLVLSWRADYSSPRESFYWSKELEFWELNNFDNNIQFLQFYRNFIDLNLGARKSKMLGLISVREIQISLVQKRDVKWS